MAPSIFQKNFKETPIRILPTRPTEAIDCPEVLKIVPKVASNGISLAKTCSGIYSSTIFLMILLLLNLK